MPSVFAQIAVELALSLKGKLKMFKGYIVSGFIGKTQALPAACFASLNSDEEKS